MRKKIDITLVLIVLGITVSCFLPHARAATMNILTMIDDNGQFTSQPSDSNANIGPADLKPSVSITNPLEGQTVNGIINITANGTDDFSLVRLELKLDGQSVKNITTTFNPHLSVQYLWNTSKYSDGNHTITAVAIDNAAQTGEMTITVNVQNSAPAPPPVNTFLLVGLIGAGIVGIFIVTKLVSAHSRKVGGKPRGKPGQVKEFNPQPEPPGKPKEFNPQPEPPGKPGDYKEFNPQPEPPGKNVKLKKKKKMMKR